MNRRKVWVNVQVSLLLQIPEHLSTERVLEEMLVDFLPNPVHDVYVETYQISLDLEKEEGKDKE